MSTGGDEFYTPENIFRWASMVTREYYRGRNNPGFEDSVLMVRACHVDYVGSGVAVRLKRFIFWTVLVFEAAGAAGSLKVTCFRPGRWMQRLAGIAAGVERERARREEALEKKRRAEKAQAEREMKKRFRPIDD